VFVQVSECSSQNKRSVEALAEKRTIHRPRRGRKWRETHNEVNTELNSWHTGEGARLKALNNSKSNSPLRRFLTCSNDVTRLASPAGQNPGELTKQCERTRLPGKEKQNEGYWQAGPIIAPRGGPLRTHVVIISTTYRTWEH
jgi:hypothetical protein